MNKPALSIAFITDAPRVAGSEVWLLDVLPLLKSHNIHPTLFLNQSAALDELSQRFGDAEIPVERYTDLDTLPNRVFGFDLRVLQVWNPQTYMALLPKLASPRLVIVHDQLDYHYPLGLKYLYREIYRATKAGPMLKADEVITVSKWGTAFMGQVMKMPQVVSICNGVNTEKFKPLPDEKRQALRKKLGFKRFTVLVPGRFAPEKNQWAAVRAARYAPELDFIFVGDMDSSYGTLVKQTQRFLNLNNVQFWGRRWDMPDLYSAADVLLQPTLAENQSLVTLEAMSSGLPIVSSAIPAQTELIKDGVNGLCLSRQPEHLATALKALAAHPQKSTALGEAARLFVLEHHQLQQTVTLFEQVVRQMV